MPSGKDRFSKLKAYLNSYAKSTADEMVSRLMRYDKANGKLAKNLKGKVVWKRNDFQIVYELEDYYEFVDKGVNGLKKRVGSPFTFKFANPSKKHVKELQKWGRMRGIPKEAAYAIGVKVKRDGIAPTQFYSLTVNRRRKQFENKVEQLILEGLSL